VKFGGNYVENVKMLKSIQYIYIWFISVLTFKFSSKIKLNATRLKYTNNHLNRSFFIHAKPSAIFFLLVLFSRWEVFVNDEFGKPINILVIRRFTFFTQYLLKAISNKSLKMTTFRVCSTNMHNDPSRRWNKC